MSNNMAIRLTITPEVAEALKKAKRAYPTLSDPEILKLGLAKVVTERDGDTKSARERDEISRMTTASLSIGGYLDDPAEDIYTADMGKRVHFS